MENDALLNRFAYSPVGTFGQIILPDGFSCYTVERPWLGNKPRKSCIPEGLYKLELRASPIVERTSRGRYTSGWEVTNVPDRSLIMLHPGNTMRDLLGCIAPGDALGYVDGLWAVLNSVDTFYNLMGRLAKQSSWQLLITGPRVEYP